MENQKTTDTTDVKNGVKINVPSKTPKSKI